MESLQDRIRRTAGRRDVSSIDLLRCNADVYEVPLRSARRVPAVVLLKRIVRRLLAPVLARQVAYNLANVRVAESLDERIEALAQQQTDLRKRIDALID